MLRKALRSTLSALGLTRSNQTQAALPDPNSITPKSLTSCQTIWFPTNNDKAQDGCIQLGFDGTNWFTQLVERALEETEANQTIKLHEPRLATSFEEALLELKNQEALYGAGIAESQKQEAIDQLGLDHFSNFMRVERLLFARQGHLARMTDNMPDRPGDYDLAAVSAITLPNMALRLWQNNLPAVQQNQTAKQLLQNCQAEQLRSIATYTPINGGLRHPDWPSSLQKDLKKATKTYLDAPQDPWPDYTLLSHQTAGGVLDFLDQAGSLTETQKHNLYQEFTTQIRQGNKISANLMFGLLTPEANLHFNVPEMRAMWQELPEILADGGCFNLNVCQLTGHSPHVSDIFSFFDQHGLRLSQTYVENSATSLSKLNSLYDSRYILPVLLNELEKYNQLSGVLDKFMEATFSAPALQETLKTPKTAPKKLPHLLTDHPLFAQLYECRFFKDDYPYNALPESLLLHSDGFTKPQQQALSGLFLAQLENGSPYLKLLSVEAHFKLFALSQTHHPDSTELLKDQFRELDYSMEDWHKLARLIQHAEPSPIYAEIFDKAAPQTLLDLAQAGLPPLTDTQNRRPNQLAALLSAEINSPAEFAKILQPLHLTPSELTDLARTAIEQHHPEHFKVIAYAVWREDSPSRQRFFADPQLSDSFFDQLIDQNSFERFEQLLDIFPAGMVLSRTSQAALRQETDLLNWAAQSPSLIQRLATDKHQIPSSKQKSAPIFTALQAGVDADMVDLLKLCTYDPQQINSQGETAVQLAKRLGQNKAVRCLKQYEQKQNASKQRPERPRHG